MYFLYICIIYRERESKIQIKCPPSYYQSANSSMVTHALGDMHLDSCTWSHYIYKGTEGILILLIIIMNNNNNVQENDD